MTDRQVLLFVLVSLPLAALWVSAIVEVLRRRDLVRVHRLVWIAALLVLPIPALAVYVVMRPPRPVRVSGVAVGAERAEELVTLAEQRQRGDLTDAEWITGLQEIGART
jgi:hypothetical protein